MTAPSAARWRSWRRRQARRRGEHVPAPVTVVVENAAAFSPNPLDANAKFENCETKPIAAAPLIDALATPRAEDDESPADAALCAGLLGLTPGRDAP